MDAEKSSSTVSWLDIREKVVEQALQDSDYEALRRISALPGGFGGDGMRRRVWPVLLQIERYTEDPSYSSDDVPHKDEAQVGLDTNRSFVAYPTGILPERKQAMQADLYDLIVGVLRRYPALSYFQGYHDILSVFYLTFVTQPLPPPPSRAPSRSHSRMSSVQNEKRPVEEESTNSEQSEKVLEKEKDGAEDSHSRNTPEWESLRRCAEAVSVLRVRDAMGSGMEGMMGMLHILKRILIAADPDLARFSSQISPVPTLPFFALSWILCLFSHDIDTLEPVQRMFDFLLSRNPISAIYLAVAILIAKKPQMMDLAQKLDPEAADDPSLLHPLFSRLPPLYPDTPDQPFPISLDPRISTETDRDDPNPYEPIPLSDLFQLADKLMVEHPWDGPDIRGKDIMGEGSVVMSYDLEMAPLASKEEDRKRWTMSDALQLVDKEVVRPGVTMVDDDEEEGEAEKPVKRMRKQRIRRRWLFLLGRNKVGTTLAIVVVVLGIVMAIFGVKAGGVHASWARWWALVIGRKVGGKGSLFGSEVGGRLGEMVRVAREVSGFVVRSLKEII